MQYLYLHWYVTFQPISLLSPFLISIFVFFVLLHLCAPILERAQEASNKATEPTLKATQPHKILNNHY